MAENHGSAAVEADKSESVTMTTSTCAGDQHSTRNKSPPFPAVSQYGPINVFNLNPGDKKLWCVCGLSKKQPWCDGSHVGTGFKPLNWEVPSKSQRMYQLCACKYTQSPPYCDAAHTYLPMKVINRQKSCNKKDKHSECRKLCTNCGWVPDF